MALPIMAAGIGLSFLSNNMGQNWGGNVNNCCQRTLGSQKSGWTGALMGGLVGLMAGGGNPLGALMGAGVGGLLGSLFGGNNHNHHCHQENPCHQQAGCYPPPCGGNFGGQQYGGYSCSPNYGNQYNQGGQWGNQGGGQQCGGQWGGDYGNQYGNQGGQWGNQGGQWGNQGGQWGNQGGQWGNQGGNGCWGGGQNYNFGQQSPQCCCCPQQRPPQGQLEQEAKGKPIEFKTSGGYNIKVDKHTITITDPKGKNTVETWGDPHENLNGKHVKDWEGKQRTICLPDGTKITMGAKGPTGVTESTSIYDGRQNVQINNNANEITHHSMNPRDTAYREQSQYDGETALFQTNNRTGVATYANIYNQDESFNVTGAYKQIGTTGGYANPKQVNDTYP